MKNIALSACLLGMCLPSAHALDAMSITYGSGGDEAHQAQIGFQWSWNKSWLETANWHLTGYWEANIGYWHGQNHPGSRSLLDFGITPVLRYQRKASREGIAPYIEAGIGVHLLSRTTIHSSRRLDTAFQFGDFIGVGVRLGNQGAYDIGYRFQHYSNAGISDHNPGMNFHEIRLQYHF